MNQFLESPSTNFARVRDGRNSLPVYVDIDLSTARSILANTAYVLEVAGNSVYSDQNILQGIATVHFQDTNLSATSAPITVNPGFIANVGFTRLLIENAAQPGKRLRIFYGVDIDFMPGTGGQVTVSGTVSVINGELERVKSGYVYIGLSNSVAVAGQLSHCQLKNPAGSGKNLILNKVSVVSSVPQFLNLTSYGTSLATLNTSVNKRMDIVPPGVGEIRSTSSATALGSYMAAFGVGIAYQSQDFQFSEPIVLPPGTGIIVVGGTVNTQILTSFQWNEESI